MGFILKLITNTQIHSYPNPQNSREFYGGKQLGYMSHPKPFLSRVIFIKELQQCKIPLYNLNKNYLLWIVNELTLIYHTQNILMHLNMSMRASHFTGSRQNRHHRRETHDTHNTHEFPNFTAQESLISYYHWQGDAVSYRSSDIIFYAHHIY